MRKNTDNGSACMKNPGAMLFANEDGIIVDIDLSACRMLSRGREEMVGHGLDEVFDASYPVVKAWLEEPRAENFATGALLLREDGSSFASKVSVVRQPEGGLHVTFREMPDRGHGEKTPRDGGELLKYGPDLIMLRDSDNIIRYASSAAKGILGYEPEEILGMFVPSLVHPGDLELAAREFAKLVVRPDARPSLVRYRHKDGSYRVLETVYNNLLENPGVRGIVCSSRDVTERVRMEGAPHESERWFRGLVQNAKDVIIVTDADSTVSYASPAIEGALGCRPEEFVGARLIDRCHPEDREMILSPPRSTVEVSDGVGAVIRFRHKDGSWRYLESFITNLLDDPRIGGILLNSRDVTGKVRDEEEIRRLNETLQKRVEQYTVQLKAAMEEAEDSEALLRLSEGRFRATFEQAAVGIVHVGLNGEWLRVNHELCNIVGYENEELLDLSFQDITYPEDLGADLEQMRRLLEDEIRSYSIENRCLHKDTTVVWCDLTVSLVRGAGGAPEYFITVVDDITSRKQAEEALKQAEAKYHSIFENSFEGIFQTTVEGRLVTANPALARMLGYDSPEEMLEYPIDVGRQLFVDAEKGREMWHLLRSRDSVVGLEGEVWRKDGGRIWLSINARIVRDDGGEIEGFEGTVQEITESREAEANLRRSLEILVALRAAGQVLGSTLESEEIGGQLLRVMCNVSGLDTAIISMEDEGKSLRIWRSVGLERLRPKARYALEAEEARRTAFKHGRSTVFRLGLLEKNTIHGVCLPLRVRNHSIGVLEAYSSHALVEDTKDILTSLANQAASALENARLYGEMADRERQLADFVGKLITAQEKERRKVAYEIHDGLAQVAAAAHQQLQAFARFYPPVPGEGRDVLDRALRLMHRTVEDARHVIAGLRPTALDDFGLETAIRMELETLKKEGWEVSYHTNLEVNERVPVAAETGLFRIAQEALTNIRKHAETKRLYVSLERLELKVRLRMLDKGRGFERRTVPSDSGPGERVGMSSMRERANMLGGSLRVRSRLGRGTLIVAEVPLSEQAEE